MSTSVKERNRDLSGEASRVKHPTPSEAADALIGGEKQNAKQKEEQKEEIGSGSPTQLPRPFSRLLRPAWII